MTIGAAGNKGGGRQRRGDETRRRVEEAAGRLFSENGYEPTTMQAIADEAGVHVQTVYLAYGTKSAVLAAAARRLVAGGDDPDSHPGERRWGRQIAGADQPWEKLRLYVRHIRDVTPRVIRLIDVLRATAPGDPDVADFLARMQQGRRDGPHALLAPLAASGQLRAGLTLAEAADITYAVASPDTFRALVEDRRWSWKRAETFVTGQLGAALLSDAEHAAALT
jgi:AcrR family transcriptional regulator